MPMLRVGYDKYIDSDDLSDEIWEKFNTIKQILAADYQELYNQAILNKAEAIVCRGASLEPNELLSQIQSSTKLITRQRKYRYEKYKEYKQFVDNVTSSYGYEKGDGTHFNRFLESFK